VPDQKTVDGILKEFAGVADVQAPAPVRFRDFRGLVRFKLKSEQIWTKVWPGDRGPPINATHWWDGRVWRDDFGGYFRPAMDVRHGRKQVQVWEWA
jgi:hypothetical protein